MQQITKQTREVGTSAGVLLPRNWLNKEVVVTLKTLSNDEIALAVTKILLEKNLLSDVKGIYLTGSYARGEQDYTSDIDILAITEKTRKIIEQGDFEIELIPEERFAKNLPKNIYFLSSVREGITLLNENLIEKYKKVKPKLNIKELTKEIERVMQINEIAIEDSITLGENVHDGASYSIVLRLRELYLISCLVHGKRPDWSRLKNKIGKKVYSAYSRIKRNEKEVGDVSPAEAMETLKLSEKWLNEVKGLRNR